MSVCEHCKNRYTWDCDDGGPYLEHGCSVFELDWDSLSEVLKRNIILILELSEAAREERCNE